jgi:hypothetical protein
MFCAFDDFCTFFDRHLATRALPARRKHAGGRPAEMHTSEVMTILASFHTSHYRNFKHYYLDFVRNHLRHAFPTLVSYARFVELEARASAYLAAYLLWHGLGVSTGIAFIDSTVLPVCNIRRAGRHRVFRDLAAFGRTGAGWFFGFKLHLVANDRGELLGVAITPGNVDDRNRDVIRQTTRRVSGKLAGDKGYLDGTLFWALWERQIELITTIRRNMKNKLVRLENKFVYRARGVIESVNHVLKDVLHIQHTRHRNPMNFPSNLFAGLCAYSFLEHKPTAAVRGAA